METIVTLGVTRRPCMPRLCYVGVALLWLRGPQDLHYHSGIKYCCAIP